MWVSHDENARERREYMVQCGSAPPICTRCDQLDCYNGACFCEACQHHPINCILCKGCKKCNNGLCICRKLVEARATDEAAEHMRREDRKKRAVIRKKEEDEAKQKAKRQRERAVTETTAYIKLKATLDAAKKEHNAIQEEFAVVKARLDVVREEFGEVKPSPRKRYRVDIDTNDMKKCETCGESRALSSFIRAGYEKKICGSCRGKIYRANKKARTDK